MTEPAFTIDTREFDAAAKALAERLPKTAGKAMNMLIRDLINLYRRSIRKESKPHKRTGHMYKHVFGKVKGYGIDTTGKVGAGGSAAVIVVHGAKPHSIRAAAGLGPTGMPYALNLARATKGIKLGEVSGWASHVEHPGVHGDPFVFRAIRRAQPEAEQRIQMATDNIVTTLAEDIAIRGEL